MRQSSRWERTPSSQTVIFWILLTIQEQPPEQTQQAPPPVVNEVPSPQPSSSNCDADTPDPLPSDNADDVHRKLKDVWEQTCPTQTFQDEHVTVSTDDVSATLLCSCRNAFEKWMCSETSSELSIDTKEELIHKTQTRLNHDAITQKVIEAEDKSPFGVHQEGWLGWIVVGGQSSSITTKCCRGSNRVS